VDCGGSCGSCPIIEEPQPMGFTIFHFLIAFIPLVLIGAVAGAVVLHAHHSKMLAAAAAAAPAVPKAYPELEGYIMYLMTLGYRVPQIRDHLIRRGWEEGIVQKELSISQEKLREDRVERHMLRLLSKAYTFPQAAAYFEQMGWSEEKLQEIYEDLRSKLRQGRIHAIQYILQSYPQQQRQQVLRALQAKGYSEDELREAQ